MKPILPRTAATSGTTEPMAASVAMDAGGVNRSPRARAAVGAAARLFVPMAIPLPQASLDTTHWIVNNERTAWRGERCGARQGRRPDRRVFSRSRTSLAIFAAHALGA